MKKLFAVLLALFVACAFCMPQSVDAAAKVPKPAIKSVKETSLGSATVTWGKLKGIAGYEMYRNGKLASSFAKSVTSHKYTNLTRGATYTFKIRAYKTKTEKQYYNKKTKKWQSKKPKKKYRGKSRKVKKRVYGAFSAQKSIKLSKPAPSPTPAPVPVPAEKTGKALAEDIAAAYAADNAGSNMTAGGFTWDTEQKTRSWTYYNGLMMKAFVMSGQKAFADRFYSAVISSDGTITDYPEGELDSVAAADTLFLLLDSDESEKYKLAIQQVYSEVEKQTVIEETGGNILHKQNADGTPKEAWSVYRLGLDGLYMYMPFLADCANAIDAGTLTLKDASGNAVNADSIYETIRDRLAFINETMRLPNGLYAHGYDPADKKTNGIAWARGEGWYCMCLADLYEKMPAGDIKNYIGTYLTSALNGVITYQDPSGLWYNVPDADASLADNRLETSASAMFTYALIKASKAGLGAGTYEAAAVKAEKGLETKITQTSAGYEVSDIYRSSGVGESGEHYCAGPYVANEAKGVAPLIMALTYF